MLTRRIFQITAILAVYTLLFIPSFSQSNQGDDGPPYNRSSDLNSGSGENSHTYGYAEVVSLGWWDFSANVTGYAYVTNCSDKEITFLLKHDFQIVWLTDKYKWFDDVFIAPTQSYQGQLVPTETAWSSYTYGYTITDEKWAAGKTFRAETLTSVSARTVGVGNEQDLWEATGCVDITFGDVR